MRRLILLFILFSFVIKAQYVPTGEYLKNPEKLKGYIDSCAAFWIPTYDDYNGGFFTNLNRYGSRYNNEKVILTQSRNVYGLSKAFMITGNDEYLELAEKAAEWMYDNGWDKTNGGWYSSFQRNGTPQNTYGNKDAFTQHYALLGIRAAYEATYDTLHWNWLMRAYEANENLWDDSEDYFGYYDYASSDWSSKHNKSFNATVDALTTHLLHLYLMTNEDKYLTRIIDVANNMSEHLVGSMDEQVIGFAEEYDTEWNIRSSETMTIMGHVLKTAWCFGRAYNLNQDESYISNAEMLIDEVLQKGYDHENGGPYKDYNRTTGDMLMWGNSDTTKAWWQMEQAVTAGLELYHLTGKDKYIKMADETLDFFMEHFVDHQYGEVYSDRTKYGEETWGTAKANGGKAAYHSIELGYLAYIYSNLFYHNEPVDLYYKFENRNDKRLVELTPLEIDDSDLVISSVELDGSKYENYNPTERTVTVPAGSEGIWKVTFERSGAVSVDPTDMIAKEYKLQQNYPNPFNPTTKIEFNLPGSSKIKLAVYDVLGREIAVLANGNFSAGSHVKEFNAAGLSSGVYFYRLTTNDKILTKKMILAK